MRSGTADGAGHGLQAPSRIADGCQELIEAASAIYRCNGEVRIWNPTGCYPGTSWDQPTMFMGARGAVNWSARNS